MAKTTVGMIGLGIMGSAMSMNLMRAGYRVIGFDVLEDPRKRHRRAGGQATMTCGEVAANADVIVTSLPSADSLLTTASELAASGRRGHIIIETSTLPIPVKEDARNRLRPAGITLLDCPLSGTGAQARVKDVIVYVSGERSAYRRAAPIMDGFSRAHYYVGAFGAGSKMKFIANLLVAIHNVATAEALTLARKAGLDASMAFKLIAAGAGTSRVLELRGPMMVKQDYSKATMKVEIWQKDMMVIADFARGVAAATPLFATTAPIYNAAMAMGRGKEDTAAVCAVLEQMAGVSLT